MIDCEKLKEILKQYKMDFVYKQWADEKFKWEAVKCFQDNWDLKAEDFRAMFKKATDKTFNLLANMNNFPKRMIERFADANPEFTRAMFINLFDETKDLSFRVEAFISSADSIREKYNDGTWNQHYQNVNSISTYLWLRYPDKYYIYKYSEYREVAIQLNSDFIPKKGQTIENLREGFKLYNEICDELNKDEELVNLLNSVITDSCYPDEKIKTLTIDVGFYISRIYSQKLKRVVKTDKPKYWMYAAGENSDKWEEFYAEGIMGIDWIGIGDVIKYKSKNEIKEKFNNIKNDTSSHKNDTLALWEFANDMNIGDVVFVKKGSSGLVGRGVVASDYFYDDTKKDYNHIRKVNWTDKGEWTHPGQFAQKTLTDITKHNGCPEKFEAIFSGEINDSKITYLSEIIASLQSLGGIASLSDICLKIVERGNLVATNTNPNWQNAVRATIQRYSKDSATYKETNDNIFYSVEGLGKGIWGLVDYDVEIKPVIDIEDSKYEPYLKQDFLNEVYLTSESYDTLSSLLLKKRNLILQGAPGVGKTFAAKRLAYSNMEEKDDSRIEFIQFHQNYSYEDFIMGYKPEGDGFELKKGIFYRFCKKALNAPDKQFFFIIDEINRGNMSKIFGELLMLIEKDYRGTNATLAYDGMPFCVPENLYIIGMMNTADRSLAMIDYALRRRFSFYEMEPGFASDGFKAYQSMISNDIFNSLIEKIRELNKDIAADSSLGKGFCIGHSYFCGLEECTDNILIEIVEYDIIPMLQEYWFDDKTKLQKWENILRGVFND